MTDNEFFYWLQGFFELSGTQAPLTRDQAECIHRHIDLVRDHCKTSAQGPAHAARRLPERIAGINALVEMITADNSGTDAIAAMATKAIRSNIHEQFVHVIDPAAGDTEQQAKLNAIHSGGGPTRPMGDPVYRC
jgi:hypothetical protein